MWPVLLSLGAPGGTLSEKGRRRPSGQGPQSGVRNKRPGARISVKREMPMPIRCYTRTRQLAESPVSYWAGLGNARHKKDTQKPETRAAAKSRHTRSLLKCSVNRKKVISNRATHDKLSCPSPCFLVASYSAVCCIHGRKKTKHKTLNSRPPPSRKKE